MNLTVTGIICLVSALLLISCVSVEELALEKIGEVLSSDSSGTVFTGDHDPRLVADALPFTMKLYELILAGQPDNQKLNFATGKNFILYANAFIQTPAEMLPDEEWKATKSMLERAKRMYLRGRDYILTAMELKYPGWKTLLYEESLDNALGKCTPEDVPWLYWSAAAWIGAYSCNAFDFSLGQEIYIPLALLLRALELDGGFSNGAIHNVLIGVYAGLPPIHLMKAISLSPKILKPFTDIYYGNTEQPMERCEYHFQTAIRLADGQNPSPYIAMAQGISIPAQDYIRFEQLMKSAIAIEVDDNPENRLEIIIYQDKARWLLENRELFFILDSFE